MNKTLAEAEQFARGLCGFLQEHPSTLHLFVVPPFTALARVCDVLRDAPVKVGAQNMHWAERGAFTGEISPLMVKDCGAQMVELGHSERRAYFGETDYTVNAKVLSALKHNLTPIVCIGETEQEKESGVAAEYVARQVKIALKGVPEARLPEILLAYEPVWAIGESGRPAEPAYADKMHALIKSAAADVFGTPAARDVPVLYGGSVSQENAAQMASQANVDGLFVGRAAWDVHGFIGLIEQVDGGRGL